MNGTISTASAKASAYLVELGREVHRGSAPLFWTSVGGGALMLIAAVLQQVDPRAVLGVSTWLKPAKFGASVLLTGPALAWMLGRLGPTSRGLRRVGVLFSVTATLELGLITLQAARGVPSHFNLTTPFDSLVFQVMGGAITLFWLGQIWLTVRAFRHRFADSALAWGMRMGLLIATLGAGMAFTMTARPTASQLASLEAGQPTLLGGHTVGAEDGGPGIPVTRWNTKAGDLRIPHFLGLHALQLLPLAGWWFSRRRANARIAARLTVTFGAGYLGLVLATLIAALRGRSISSMDPLVAGSSLLLAGIVASTEWFRVTSVDGSRPGFVARMSR